MDNQDWRLQNQETYLSGVTLCWKQYEHYSEGWDHDHCAFCWVKFATISDIPDALHAGYTTTDNYHWICKQCFDDFYRRFEWKVVEV